MPYTRTRKSVQRVEHILRELLTASDDVVYQSLEPSKLAYQLHEAFKSAAVYPEYFVYAELRGKFTVRLRPGRVVLEYKGKQIVALKVVKEQLSKMNVPGVADIMGIVGAATTHKASEMYFPDARLEDDELARLLSWCSSVGYFIVNNYDQGVTLTKANPGEMAWVPTVSGNMEPSQ